LLQAVKSGELDAQIQTAAVKLRDGFVNQNHPSSVTINMGMNKYLGTLRINGRANEKPSSASCRLPSGCSQVFSFNNHT
jgi:hypothetical protein